MEKIIIVLAVILSSCTGTSNKKNAENSQRIIDKESSIYNGIRYQIIEVDGVEYLSNSNGGICPLEIKK